MVDFGITEKDFHTEWYLTGRKNQLLKDLANSLGDAELYKMARELKSVVQELNEIKRKKQKEERENERE